MLAIYNVTSVVFFTLLIYLFIIKSDERSFCHLFSNHKNSFIFQLLFSCLISKIIYRMLDEKFRTFWSGSSMKTRSLSIFLWKHFCLTRSLESISLDFYLIELQIKIQEKQRNDNRKIILVMFWHQHELLFSQIFSRFIKTTWLILSTYNEHIQDP